MTNFIFTVLLNISDFQMADAESLKVEERTNEITEKGIKVVFETDLKLKDKRQELN